MIEVHKVISNKSRPKNEPITEDQSLRVMLIFTVENQIHFINSHICDMYL